MGARLLPQVSEPAGRLHQGLVERRELGRRWPVVRKGDVALNRVQSGEAYEEPAHCRLFGVVMRPIHRLCVQGSQLMRSYLYASAATRSRFDRIASSRYGART